MITEKEIENIIRSEDIKLLIFDCDGTLMETLGLHYKAWSEAFQQHDHDFIDENEFITKYAGVSGEEMVSSVANKLEYSLDTSVVLANKKKIFTEKYIFQVKPIERTLSLVKKYSGQLKMVVASGGEKETVTKMLLLNDIIGLFDQIVAIEDVEFGKPAPDIFLKAAESQDILPSNCLVFEDHIAGFTAARNAGMIHIDVNELIL